MALSMHFQVLIAGTLAYLVALFSPAWPPHTNAHEQWISAAAESILWGVLTTGCYLAFVTLVIGHALLERRPEKS